MVKKGLRSNRASLEPPLRSDDSTDPADHLVTTPLPDEPLSLTLRLVLASIALAWVVAFVVARGLEPDPRGYGTHLKLGLPPCVTLRSTGLPCPTCGLTTSFAWLARFRPVEAVKANPAGPVLAGWGMALVVVCGRGALEGRRSGACSIARSICLLLLGAWTTVVVVGLYRRLYYS